MLTLTLTPDRAKYLRPGDITTVILKVRACVREWERACFRAERVGAREQDGGARTRSLAQPSSTPLPCQATNAGSAPLDLAGLGVELVCTESVDTGRVDRRYVGGWGGLPTRPALPGAAAPPRPARRRVERLLYAPPPALVVASATLPAGATRAWTVSARLPEGGPPSFSGAAASFRWVWRAGARYAAGASAAPAEEQQGDGDPPGQPPPSHHHRPYGWLEAGAVPALLNLLPPRPAPGSAPPPGCVAAGPGADPPPPPPFDGPAAAAAPGAALVVADADAGAGAAAAATSGQWRPAVAPAPADKGAADGAAAPLMSLSPARGGGGSGRRESSSSGLAETAAATAPPTPPGTASPFTRAFSLRVAGPAAPAVTLALRADPGDALSPGGVLRGHLDFSALHSSSSDCPRCVFYAVSLECVEGVAAEWAPGGGRRGFSEEDGGDAPPPAAVTVADEAAEAVAHLLTSHFSLCLPAGLPPTLATPLVAVRWRLRFEFCCESGGGGGGGGSDPAPPPARGWFGGGRAAPARPPPPPPIEWTLPVLVLPAGGGEGGEGA